MRRSPERAQRTESPPSDTAAPDHFQQHEQTDVNYIRVSIGRKLLSVFDSKGEIYLKKNSNKNLVKILFQVKNAIIFLGCLSRKI